MEAKAKFRKVMVLLGLVMALLVVFTPTVLAAQEINPDVEIWVEETGEAKICSGVLCVETTQADLLLTAWETGVLTPDFTQLWEMADAYGIETAVIVKSGQEIDIGMNGQIVVHAVVGEEDLERLTAEFMAEANEMVMPWLLSEDLVIAFHFTDLDAPGGLSLEAMSSPSAPHNFVEAGVTVSPEGMVTSVAGVRLVLAGEHNMYDDSLGVAVPRLDPDIMATLARFGIEEANLKLVGDSLTLRADESQVTVDMERVMDMVGYSMEEPVSSWLEDSQMDITVVITDELSSTPPHIALARPIVVEISEEGAVSVEGMSLGITSTPPSFVFEDGLFIAATPGEIQASTAWGAAVANYEPGAISAIGNAIMPKLAMVDWPWMEGLLADATFNVEVRPMGSTVQPWVQFEGREVPPVVAVVPVSVGDDGTVALWDQLIPVDVFGVEVEPIVPMIDALQLRSVSVGVDDLTMDVGGAGVSVQLERGTRENLLQMTTGLPPFVVGLINQGLAFGADKMLQVAIERVDTVPPGFVSQAVGWYLLFYVR